MVKKLRADMRRQEARIDRVVQENETLLADKLRLEGAVGELRRIIDIVAAHSSPETVALTQAIVDAEVLSEENLKLRGTIKRLELVAAGAEGRK